MARLLVVDDERSICSTIEAAVRASTNKIADELLGTPEPDEGQDLEG